MTTNSEQARRAALYLRVSTDDQSNENQRAALVQLARTRGFDIVEVFEEKVSATKTDRAELRRMTVAAHAGKFDVLLVAALDRLGRSMVGNLQLVLDLDRVGVEVISIREPWLQMSGPVRSLLIAVFSWVAEEERRQISERSKAGVARARREGKVIGRPRGQIDMDKALLLRRRGQSLRKVARQLGCGASTLARAYQAYDALHRSCAGTTPDGGTPGVREIADLDLAENAAE